MMNQHILLYSDKTSIKTNKYMSNFAQEYSIIKAFIIKGSNKESDRGAIHFAPMDITGKRTAPLIFYALIKSLVKCRLFLRHIFHSLYGKGIVHNLIMRCSTLKFPCFLHNLL